MSNNIPLNREGGLEPHLCTCPSCNKDTQELTIGVLYKAEYEGQTIYADRDSRAKTRRELGNPDIDWIHVKENERVPGNLCADCEQHFKAVKEEVAAGGIHFKCKECGWEGALKKDSGIAKDVRKHSGIQAPDPVGLEFESCEQHEDISPTKH